MNLNQFLQRAPSYLQERYAIHLIGSSGIGKSDSVEQLVANLSKQRGHKVGLSTTLCQSMTPPDFLGFLMGATKKIKGADGKVKDVAVSEFLMPAWQISDEGIPMNEYQSGVVFFDEYGQSDPDTKRAGGEPILHVRAGRNQLHDGIGVILASNDVQHRSGVTKSFDFIINRTTEWHIKPHLGSWLGWANRSGKVDPLWIAYAERHPDNIFSGKHPDKQGPWCSPRSYVRYTRILTKDFMPGGRLTEDQDARALMLEEGVGAIGTDVTEDIFSWCKVQTDVPTVDEVEKSPTKAMVPTSPDAVVLIVYMLVHAATAKNIAALVSYVERLPVEFSTTFVLGLHNRNRALMVNPAVAKKLTVRNPKLVDILANL